jgi:hypothetical protein
MLGSRARHFLSPFVATGSLVLSFGFASVALVPGCGGSAAEPETPADEPAGNDGEGKAAAEAPKEEAEAEAAPEPEEKKESPKDILLREGTLFLIDFNKSDPGKKIEEKCESKYKDDVAKKAHCVSKDMGKLTREGFTFDQDDDGNWWYIRFGIEKNNVQVVYNKVQVEVGEPEGDKVTLKPTGKDEARRRKGTVPKSLEFEVPDEYTIVLNDPKRGRLEFEPKLGLLQEGQPQ